MRQLRPSKRTTCDLCGDTVERLAYWPSFVFAFDEAGPDELAGDYEDVCPACVEILRTALAAAVHDCLRSRKGQTLMEYCQASRPTRRRKAS